PVDPRANAPEDRRQQRQRHGDRDERDQHAAEAHAAQRRLGQDDERNETDTDRQPRQEHRPAGGRDRGRNPVSVLAATRALLAPARDDEQRVIDGDAEPDERNQELDDGGDVGDIAEPEDDQQRCQDGKRSDQERYEGKQRRKDEREHGER